MWIIDIAIWFFKLYSMSLNFTQCLSTGSTLISMTVIQRVGGCSKFYDMNEKFIGFIEYSRSYPEIAIWFWNLYTFMLLCLLSRNVKKSGCWESQVLNRNVILLGSLMSKSNCFTGFNLFHSTGLFLYPLKTSEQWRFSDIFRGFWTSPVV